MFQHVKMRFKFTILFIFFIESGPEIKSYELDREPIFGSIIFSCKLRIQNKYILLNGIISIRQDIQNVTKIYFEFCKSMPFKQLTDTLGSEVNETEQLSIFCSQNMKVGD